MQVLFLKGGAYNVETKSEINLLINVAVFAKGEWMSKVKRETRLEGRSAETGRFTSIEKARQYPKTHLVERVPLPGKGRK